MKKYLTAAILLLILCGGNAIELPAQHASINNNGAPVHTSVILDIKSTDRGILLPGMTAMERSTILSPAKGLLVFQVDGTPGFYYYDGRQWLSLADGEPVNNDGFSPAYALSTVFAGSTYGFVNGIGTNAKFKKPYGIAADRAGNIYVADSGSHMIRKINPMANVTSVAGSLVAGNTDGIGTAAKFNHPCGITIDKNGNVYVADTYNKVIRKIDNTGLVTKIAGSGAPDLVDGNGPAAAFYFPLALAGDTAGNIYIADNNSIRKMTPNADVTTLAGGVFPGSVDGTGTAASFAGMSGLVLDAAGNIYVADRDNHKIRKVTLAGMVTTFAGSGTPGNNDGPIGTALFNSPKAIAIDIAGNFYIADAGNHTIRKISADGMVSTLAGNNSPGNAEGTGAAAYFNDPSGLVIDGSGNLYVSDSRNHLIRKIIIR